MKLRVKVYNAANSSELAAAWVTDSDGFQRNIDEMDATGRKLNESGDGRVTIQVDHPSAEYVVVGNVLRFYGDTNLLWSARIDGVEEVTTARSHRDRVYIVDVIDLLEDWAKATVDPWDPDMRPISAERVWNWASPPLDRSSWIDELYLQTRTVTPLRPEAWPSPTEYSDWVWTRAYTEFQPAGDVPFVHWYNLESDADVVHFVACDDEFEVLIDGTYVERHAVKHPDTSGWEKTYRFVVPHTAGDHLFAARCRNHYQSAAFLHIAFTVANGVIDEPLFGSGGGELDWLALDYPATWPGFTGPEIMQMLLTEAQARGALTGWTISVHGTHDEIEEFSVRVDQSYRSVLEGLREWMDFRADDAGLVLHLYPGGDLDTSPSVTVAVKSLSSMSTTEGLATAVKGVWSDGVRWQSRSNHPKLGRVEHALQLGAVKSTGAVDDILNRYLDVHAVEVPEVVAEVVDESGKQAGVDYTVGDTVTVPGFGSARTVGITWAVERNGDLSPSVEFEATAAGRRRDLTHALDRQIRSHDDPLSAPLLSSEPLVVSGRPSTNEVSWSWSEDIEDAVDPEDPDAGWQPYEPETVQRAYSFGVEIKPEDLPDAFGTTRLQLFKNGSIWHSLFYVDLTTLLYKAEIPIFAYFTIRPGDQITVHPVEGMFGGHVNGRVWVGLADAV